MEQVVGVLVTLMGLAGTVLIPIIKLNTNITRLNVTMQHIADKLSSMEKSNHESHARLWEKNEEQDKTLRNHDGRISLLEHK